MYAVITDDNSDRLESLRLTRPARRHRVSTKLVCAVRSLPELFGHGREIELELVLLRDGVVVAATAMLAAVLTASCRSSSESTDDEPRTQPASTYAAARRCDHRRSGQAPAVAPQLLTRQLADGAIR